MVHKYTKTNKYSRNKEKDYFLLFLLLSFGFKLWIFVKQTLMNAVYTQNMKKNITTLSSEV
jgi:hypothetical protein